MNTETRRLLNNAVRELSNTKAATPADARQVENAMTDICTVLTMKDEEYSAPSISVGHLQNWLLGNGIELKPSKDPIYGTTRFEERMLMAVEFFNRGLQSDVKRRGEEQFTTWGDSRATQFIDKHNIQPAL